MTMALAGPISFSSCVPSLSPPSPCFRFFYTGHKLLTNKCGKTTQITGTRSISGGCINRASRYDSDAGSFFVKTNRSIGPEMFKGEALGLNAMYATASIRATKQFKVGPLPTGGSCIIMEYIEFGASIGNQSILGRKLAEMHKAGKFEKGFGFDIDNTIGREKQKSQTPWKWAAADNNGYRVKEVA